MVISDWLFMVVFSFNGVGRCRSYYGVITVYTRCILLILTIVNICVWLDDGD